MKKHSFGAYASLDIENRPKGPTVPVSGETQLSNAV